MAGRFGSQWTTKWASGSNGKDGNDTGIENAKRVWGSELAGYSGAEIKAGIAAPYKFPPSCDEFKLNCREPIDPEASFYEAVEQMQRRSTHTDRWSHPAIYWAAATIGTHNLHYGTWTSMGARWTKLFNAQMSAGEWQPIPSRVPELPPPPPIGRSDENAATYQALAGTVLSKKPDPKAWAKYHKANYMAGKRVEAYQYNLAAPALGETIELWEKQRKAAHAQNLG